MPDPIYTKDSQTGLQVKEGTFEDIYRKYWSQLYLYAYHILRDKDLAKDVIQEVFITLLKSEKISEINNVRSYLFQSVKYQVYKLVRSEKVKLKVFEQLNSSDLDNSTVELMQEKELQQRIEQSVNSLPDKCRTIFSLKQEGYTAKAIAATTGLSQRTVEHQIYLAVKKLRCSLQGFIILLVLTLAFLRL